MRRCPQCQQLGIPSWAIPGPLARTKCRVCSAQVSATWASTIIPILLMLVGWAAFLQIGSVLWRLVVGLGLFVAGLVLWQMRAQLVVK